MTNNAKERFDVWIDQPGKSIILEITSDVRMIKLEVLYATISQIYFVICYVSEMNNQFY